MTRRKPMKNLGKGLTKVGKGVSKGLGKSIPKGIKATEDLFMKPFKGLAVDLFAGRIHRKRK